MRSLEVAARAVNQSKHLRLVGVAGDEGLMPGTAIGEPAGLEAYVDSIAQTARQLKAERQEGSPSLTFPRLAGLIGLSPYDELDDAAPQEARPVNLPRKRSTRPTPGPTSLWNHLVIRRQWMGSGSARASSRSPPSPQSRSAPPGAPGPATAGTGHSPHR